MANVMAATVCLERVMAMAMAIWRDSGGDGAGGKLCVCRYTKKTK